MWTAALQDRRIQFGVPLLVEPPGEGGPPFKKCRFLGSALQTELLDSGWAPTKSVFNMHPRWFSGKPTFQKQDCGVEAGRWERRVFDSISAMAEEGHTSPCFSLGQSKVKEAESELTKSQHPWKGLRTGRVAGKQVACFPGSPKVTAGPAQRRILLPTRGRCRGRALLWPLRVGISWN